MTEKKWRILSVFLMLILVPSLIANFAARPKTKDEQQTVSDAPVADETSGPIPFYDEGTVDSEIDEALVARYYGSCDTVDGLVTYDISMIYHRPTTPEEHGHPYEFVLSFRKFATYEVEQTISYTSDLCTWAETIGQGLTIADVNDDGSDDLLLDLGLIGQMYHTVCFVYDAEKGFVEVEGSSELSTPQYNGGLFVTEEPGRPGHEYYQVIGDKLILVG